MKKLIIPALVTILVGCGVATPVIACGEDDNTLSNCTETTGETSDDTYAAADTKIESNRALSHSFFLAGNEVTSSDIVDGVHFVAGNLVRVEGSSDYAAVAGNSVTISGAISHDLFVAGNSVEISDSASIGRDLFAFGNIVTIKSNLYGNAFLSGDRLVLENVTIIGDLDASFSEIVIKGKSAISGTFRYSADTTITGLENLTAGATEVSPSIANTVSFKVTFMDKFIGLLGVFILTAVLIALMPKFAKKLLDDFYWATSWKHLALGLGLILVVPFVSAIVMLTIIGLPLALVTLGVYLFFIGVSSSITGGIIGDQLARSAFKKPRMNIYAKFAIGMSILFVLELIPFVGGLVSAISLCFGVGYLSKRIFARK